MTTRNMKDALIARLEQLRTMNATELDYSLTDIIDDLLSSRVTIRCKVSESIGSPVPAYDRENDGDYSEFLVANSCD